MTDPDPQPSASPAPNAPQSAPVLRWHADPPPSHSRAWVEAALRRDAAHELAMTRRALETIRAGRLTPRLARGV